MVERGTGPRSLMEGSKGGQEPGGGLAVYVSRTELSMSSSVCELFVEKSVSLFSGVPCPSFYRPRGAGLTWRRKDKKPETKKVL